MRFLAFAAAVFMSAQACAMPCDGSFQCKSASGRYKIEISRCRYDNHLGSIQALQIGGADVSGAELGAAFDGEEFGGFEIALAAERRRAAHPLGGVGAEDRQGRHPGQVARRKPCALTRQASRKRSPARRTTEAAQTSGGFLGSANERRRTAALPCGPIYLLWVLVA